MAKTKRRLVIDELALAMRKPRAGPILDPDEVIAIGLSVVPSLARVRINPKGPEVRAVMLALKLAQWKIVAA